LRQATLVKLHQRMASGWSAPESASRILISCQSLPLEETV
jgi:hypothetical protein